MGRPNLVEKMSEKLFSAFYVREEIKILVVSEKILNPHLEVL